MPPSEAIYVICKKILLVVGNFESLAMIGTEYQGRKNLAQLTKSALESGSDKKPGKL
jgi:hypothetical protein